MKYEERLTQWAADGASLILDNPTTAEEARQQVMVQFKKACIKLAELEDKIERGELVGAIWFKSWLNGIVCCGRVIGYEDGGFVIESGDDLISAEKIYTSREQAENDKNKNDEDLQF